MIELKRMKLKKMREKELSGIGNQAELIRRGNRQRKSMAVEMAMAKEKSYGGKLIKGLGAYLGSRKKGGKINKTGLYKLHEGEFVSKGKMAAKMAKEMKKKKK